MKCWAPMLHQMIWVAAVEWCKLLWSHRRQWFFEWIVHIMHLVFATRADWWTRALRGRRFRSAAWKANQGKSNSISIIAVGRAICVPSLSVRLPSVLHFTQKSLELTSNFHHQDSMHTLADRRDTCVRHLHRSKNDLRLANDRRFDCSSTTMHRCKTISLAAPHSFGTIAMDSHNSVDIRRCCNR